MKIKSFLKCGFQFVFYSLLCLFFISCASLTPEKKELNEKIAIAENASSKNNYEVAAKNYIEAVIKAETADPEQVYALKKALSQTYINWSRELYWKAKTEKSPEIFKKAIYICEKALNANPKYKVKCGVYISKFKKELASLKYKKETSINNLIPDSKERNYKIAVLYKQGEILRKDRKFMKARDKFEEILLLDPFNLDATRQISKIMKSVAEVGKKRQEADEIARMAEVEWKYVEPIAKREEAMEMARREAEAGSELQSKLADSRIEIINFKDTPLDKAFNDLEKSIARAIRKDFKFEFKGFSPSDKKFSPVTFKAKKIPADSAIEALCKGFNMYPIYSKDRVIIEQRPE